MQLLTRIFDVLCFFQALAEALKINSSLRNMNLAGNKIGPEGAQARPVSDVLGSGLDVAADVAHIKGYPKYDDNFSG